MTIVDGVPDETAASKLILTAVKDALRQAVAFMPTLVVVEDARVVGGHLYLLVLAADSEGGDPDAGAGERAGRRGAHAVM